MARRLLDTSFWDEPDVAALSIGARLLLICMITDTSLSDDYGVLPASAAVLKKHAFGYDDISLAEVCSWRDEILARCRNVRCFEHDGQQYLWLRNFDKWQPIRHKRASNLPKPPNEAAVHDETSCTAASGEGQDGEISPIDEVAEVLPQSDGGFPQIAENCGKVPQSDGKLRKFAAKCRRISARDELSRGELSCRSGNVHADVHISAAPDPPAREKNAVSPARAAVGPPPRASPGPECASAPGPPGPVRYRHPVSGEIMTLESDHDDSDERQRTPAL